MTEVSISLSDPVAQLGPYTVGIYLTDPAGTLRIDGEQVAPPHEMVDDWAKLPGYPIEVRSPGDPSGMLASFRLVDREHTE